MRIHNNRTMKTTYIPIHKFSDLFLAGLLLFTYVGEHFGFNIGEMGTGLVILHGLLHVVVVWSLLKHVFKRGDDV